MTKSMLKSAAAIACCTLSSAAVGAAAGPNFSPHPAVSWISTSGDWTQPASGPGPIVQDPKVPHISNEEFRRTGKQPTIAVGDPNSAILQPWAKEALRKHNEIVLAGKGGLSLGAACWPVGVPVFNLHGVHPIFFVQAPKEVLMIQQSDQQVRHIYLTDKHSPDVKPSWYGESIGHYEGGSLVVDTIGIDDRTLVDGFGTPHTKQLHVIERFRLIEDGQVLEANVHVDDPGAFTKPWTGIQLFRQ